MRVLFIRYKKSKGIFEGGEQGSQQHLDSIASIVGWTNVDTYYVHDENQGKTLFGQIKGAVLFLFNYFYGMSPKRVKEIIKMSSDYDVVFIDRSVFGILAKKLKKAGYKGKVMTFFHNVEVPYFRAKLGNKNPIAPILLRCIDKNDLYSCQYSDKIIVLNTRDGNEIARRYGREADYFLPVSFNDKYANESMPSDTLTSKKPSCLFVGAYFTPNNEGIVWFVKNVLPHVDIDLKIVGKGMAKLKEEEPALKDICVESDVADLKPYFEQADIMILPIFKGSGMKVKTCESLMYGKNILGTSESYVGYNLDYDKVGGLCDNAKDFINAINGFIANPRPRFNTYSRNYYMENHSPESTVKRFREILFQDNPD